MDSSAGIFFHESCARFSRMWACYDCQFQVSFVAALSMCKIKLHVIFPLDVEDIGTAPWFAGG
jgi:hypothetical protein